MIRRLVIAATAIGLVASIDARAEPLDVSMIQLLANPAAFDGKLVRVSGFIRIEFEGDALYLHKEDDDHGIYRNAFWIDLPRALLASSKHLNGTYVLIEGIVDAHHRGHLDMFSGALTRVSRIESLRTSSSAGE